MSSEDPPILRREADRVPPPSVVTAQTMKLGRDIRHWLNILTGLTVFLLLFVSVLAIYSWRQSARNTTALCALRDNALQRADSNARFLTEHPHGIAGLRVEDIQTTINQSRTVVKALAILNCPLPKEPPGS